MEESFASCIQKTYKNIGGHKKSIVEKGAVTFLRESVASVLHLISERRRHASGSHVDRTRKAVLEVFADELGKHARSEGEKALGGRPTIVNLAEFDEINHLDANSKVFITGAIQYMMDEVLELAMMSNGDENRSQNISTRSIENAIHKDDELRVFFSNIAVQNFLIHNEATFAADLLWSYKNDIEANSVVYVPDDVALRFVAEHLGLLLETVLESPVLLKMLKYAVNPEGFTVTDNDGQENIDGLDVLHVMKSDGVTYKILDGLLGKGNDLNEIAESQDFKEIIDGWDEGDQDPSRFLDIIRKRHMNPEDATYVFAYYTNYNELTVETVEEFMALGVDINAISTGYRTDSHNDNALTAAAEYRKVSNIRVLLECGAEVEQGGSEIVDALIYGHSTYYTIIDQNDLETISQGLDLLLGAGQIVTREIIDYVREEFGDNEYKTQLIGILEGDNL